MAFGYYRYQRGKILRDDKADIYQTISDMIIDIEEFINKDNSISDADKDQLRQFVTQLQTANEEQDFGTIVECLSSVPQSLSEIFTDSFPSIIDQVRFHIKKK